MSGSVLPALARLLLVSLSRRLVQWSVLASYCLRLPLRPQHLRLPQRSLRRWFPRLKLLQRPLRPPVWTQQLWLLQDVPLFDLPAASLRRLRLTPLLLLLALVSMLLSRRSHVFLLVWQK